MFYGAEKHQAHETELAHTLDIITPVVAFTAQSATRSPRKRGAHAREPARKKLPRKRERAANTLPRATQLSTTVPTEKEQMPHGAIADNNARP